MGAPSETYVDPSINANSGTGTIGDPYGDLQYALDTMTRDATNGDRINIKSGTAEVLTGTISLASYGLPRFDRYLVLEGYDSVAGDGGIGAIDGNAGNFTIFNSDYISVKNLKLFNTGTAVVIDPPSYAYIQNCEITQSSTGGILGTHYVIVEKCYVHDIAGYGVKDCRRVANCYFENGTTDKFTNAAEYLLASLAPSFTKNLFSLDSATNAIECGHISLVTGNSVLCSGGTGYGIKLSRTMICNNNLVEGFSGTGGAGLYGTGTHDLFAVDSNAVYNCTTNYDYPNDIFADDNETLVSSPFAKTGSLPTDFTSATFWSDLYAYFAPVDIGNVYDGFPAGTNQTKGAVGQPVYSPTYSLHPLAYN